MINFEYGGYSFEYNEFQHKLGVKCDGEELLLDASNFDLGKMADIYEHLINYFDFKHHADKLGEVLIELRENYLSPSYLEETEEVYDFLKRETDYELNELDAMLGGYEVDEE